MQPRFLVIPLLAVSLPTQQRTVLTLAQVYDRAAEHRSVALDEDVSLALPIGQGLRLDCPPNPAGLASVVLLFTEDEQVWTAARDHDGYGVERTSSPSRRCRALLKQIGCSPLLVAASWTWADDRVHVTARISSDPTNNQRLRERASAPDAATALLLRNHVPFPAAELPEDERIAGWALLWSEVKYHFAFFDQVPELDWDAEFAAALPAVRAARTAPDYYRVLNRSLAKLRDGHTDIWGPGLGIQGDAHLPVRLAFDTKRQLRIESVVALDSVSSPEVRDEIAAASLVRGERITHWDGKPVGELLDAEIRPWICASTPQGGDLRAARLLTAGAPGSRVTLRVAGADGGERDVELRRARYPLPDPHARDFTVRELDGGVLYVNLPSFGSKEIVEQFVAQALPKLRTAQGLILDVRGNGGGDSGNGWNIVRHLIERPIPKTAWKTRQHRPAFRAWGRPDEWHHGEPSEIRPAAEPFRGPIAILVGPATFSAAEDFVAVLHAAKRATVVGRPTGGSTGQPLRVELPGGGGARICTKRDTYPDGREFVGVGIQPDVVVDPLRLPDQTDPELARALTVVRAAAERR